MWKTSAQRRVTEAMGFKYSAECIRCAMKIFSNDPDPYRDHWYHTRFDSETGATSVHNTCKSSTSTVDLHHEARVTTIKSLAAS